MLQNATKTNCLERLAYVRARAYVHARVRTCRDSPVVSHDQFHGQAFYTKPNQPQIVGADFQIPVSLKATPYEGHKRENVPRDPLLAKPR